MIQFFTYVEALFGRFKKSNIPFEVSVYSVFRPFFKEIRFKKIKNCNYCNQKYIVNELTYNRSCKYNILSKSSTRWFKIDPQYLH